MYRALAESIEHFSRGIAKSNRPADRKLGADYLAALAPLLARATLGEDILKDFDAVDRLFGKTWIVDVAPFKDAFDKWAVFKSEYTQHAVSGMTVNERLYAIGKTDEFDAARQSRDRDAVRQLLLDVYVDEPSIQKILEQL